jgi:hypothetical protein
LSIAHSLFLSIRKWTNSHLLHRNTNCPFAIDNWIVHFVWTFSVYRIGQRIGCEIRFHANWIKTRFSVRHENQASTRTILLHPILHTIPCFSVAWAVSMCFPEFADSQKTLFVNNFKHSYQIGGDWCRIGNRTENCIAIRFACKSDRDSDAKTTCRRPFTRQHLVSPVRGGRPFKN